PDHIADKLLAICETHVQAGQTRVSSRVKDLVDIGLIASTHRLDGHPLRTAIVAGAAHRGLSLPTEFTIPAPRTWRARYNTSARDASAAPTFDDTMTMARRLLNPVLTGSLDSSWDPTTRDWTPPEDRTS
ncbi:MAG: nucleotidyl transferase AbiEii/AbiGii toxin family protein, partial [Nocardioidaceae bacterium]